MSQVTNPNYLARLSALRSIPDVRSRTSLLLATAAAVMLPLFQIAIPATGQGRVLDLGLLTGLDGWSPVLVLATAAVLVAPVVPSAARIVRAADIAMAALALMLAWIAWSGLRDAQEMVERVAAFGALVDDRFAPVTSWRWGLPVALCSFGIAVWRGAIALTRSLHDAAR